MDWGTFFNLFLIVGAIHGFIFIVVTFFLRKQIEKPVLFLNLFVLFLSLNNLQSWILEARISDDIITDFVTFPWYFMIAPMFYSFLIHYLEIEKKKNPLVLIAITLFAVAVVIRFTLISLVKTDTITVSVLKNYNLFEDAFALAYSIFLFYLSIDIVKKQQKLYPKFLGYDNLKWILLFLKLGGIVFLFWIIAVLLNIFSETIKAPYSYYPLRIVSSILIYWVAYQAFFRYRLLKDRIKLRQLIKKDRPEASGREEMIHLQRTKFTFNEFEAYVIENKSFLNPSLSLDGLAEEFNIGASTLSKVVNSKNFNFSDCINSYRVEEAKKILNHSDFSNYTIVAIGLECGFNSKSTFYTAFKKSTGKTPSEYKKGSNT